MNTIIAGSNCPGKQLLEHNLKVNDNAYAQFFNYDLTKY